jgi:hypothetical protein
MKAWNHYRRKIWQHNRFANEYIIHCPPEYLPKDEENISYEPLNRIYYADLFSLESSTYNKDTNKIVLRWQFFHGFNQFVTTATTFENDCLLADVLEDLSEGDGMYYGYVAFVQCQTGAVYVDPYSRCTLPVSWSERNSSTAVWNCYPWMDRDAAYAIMKPRLFTY